MQRASRVACFVLQCGWLLFHGMCVLCCNCSPGDSEARHSWDSDQDKHYVSKWKKSIKPGILILILSIIYVDRIDNNQMSLYYRWIILCIIEKKHVDAVGGGQITGIWTLLFTSCLSLRVLELRNSSWEGCVLPTRPRLHCLLIIDSGEGYGIL